MKTDKRKCGCHISRIGQMPARIAYCPVHEAAPDLLQALRDLARRCDGREGVRADGSNIDTLSAWAVLRRFERFNAEDPEGAIQ